MDPGDVQSDIARHREDLGRTVDELTERLDVKKQAKRQAVDLKAQGEQRVQDVKVRFQQADNAEMVAMAGPVLAVVLGVAAVVGVIWWRRRERQGRRPGRRTR